MTTIALSSADPTSITADAIIIAVAAGDDGVRLLPGAEPVDAAFRGSLATTLGHLGATGKAGEVTKVPASGAAKAAVVVAVGAGTDGEGTTSPGDAPPRRRRRCPGPGRHSLGRRRSPGGRRRRRRRRGRGTPARVVHVLRLQDGQRQATPGRRHHRHAHVQGQGGQGCRRPCRDRRRGGEPDPELGQHTGARPHARGVRRTRRRPCQGTQTECRRARREGTGQAWVRRHSRRRPGLGEPAPAGSHRLPAVAGQAARRARRQGHHVRLGRAVAQAERRHGGDEVRHERCRRGRGGRRRRGPAGAACLRHGLRAHGREHAVGQELSVPPTC